MPRSVFGTRWSTRTGPYDPKAVVPLAYHIEVAESEAARVAELLQRDYASGQHMFPMGIKMQFVPDVNQLMNFNTCSKTAQLASRQLAFEDKMAYANPWEITDLYSVDKKCGQCLADMITMIPSMKIPHLKVFHSVTPGFHPGTTTFAFIPQLEQEARAPWWLHCFPTYELRRATTSLSFFAPTGADRAQACEWDPVMKIK